MSKLDRNKLLETDLHLHLDGSLSPEVVRVLAEQAGYDLEGKDLKRLLTAPENCKSLPEYLECFELPGKLLQTKEVLRLAAKDLVERLADEGVIYAEIRFAPQLHTRQGLHQEDAVKAVVQGVADGCVAKNHQIHVGVLLCSMVNGPDEANEETLELAAAYLLEGVVGADIAGPEGLIPMEHFEPMFRKAYRLDVPFTIHAGETGNYENIEKAVSYGARRIGHGCAAVQSGKCMDLLKRENITLEMCVISNLQTKAVASLEEHPLKVFYDRGIRVAYNTDNMTVSDTNLAKEAGVLLTSMGFTEADLKQMNRYALEAAFIGEQEKNKLLAQFVRNFSKNL